MRLTASCKLTLSVISVIALRVGVGDVAVAWLLGGGCNGCDDGVDSTGNDEGNDAEVTILLGCLDAELEALLLRWRSHAGLKVRLRPPRSLDELRACALFACAVGPGTPGRRSPEPGLFCQSVALEVDEVDVVIVMPFVGALAVNREMGIIQCPLGAFFIWK